jgi:molybdenum cofactor biosynthesis enzyme MoaA
VARAAIREAEELGVKEIYFTGGEPFLHGDILSLLALALQTAPTTVLTNGTLIDAIMADELAALAAATPYSLEIRVSLDDTTGRRTIGSAGRGRSTKPSTRSAGSTSVGSCPS